MNRKGPPLGLEHSRVLAYLCGRVGQTWSQVKVIIGKISITHHAFSGGFCFGTLKDQTTYKVTQNDLL